MKEIKRQVPWTKSLLESFITEGMPTKDEEFVMRTRCSGWSQVKQSMSLNVSTSTISNIITKCKRKYDYLHQQFPDRFPERVTSKVEEAMDTGECTPSDKSQLCRTCKYRDKLKYMTAIELLDCMDNCHYTL